MSVVWDVQNSAEFDHINIRYRIKYLIVYTNGTGTVPYVITVRLRSYVVPLSGRLYDRTIVGPTVRFKIYEEKWF